MRKSNVSTNESPCTYMKQPSIRFSFHIAFSLKVLIFKHLIKCKNLVINLVTIFFLCLCVSNTVWGSINQTLKISPARIKKKHIWDLLFVLVLGLLFWEFFVVESFKIRLLGDVFYSSSCPFFF